MDGGHETFNDTKLVIDDFCEGCKAVGRARGVGDNVILWVISIKVDTADEHGCIGGWRRDDDLFSTTFQVGRCLFLGGEDTLIERVREMLCDEVTHDDLR